MAWKEWDKEALITQDEKELSPGITVAIALVCCVFCILMYLLGKSDGREDALNSSVTNCATVEILEDN